MELNLVSVHMLEGPQYGHVECRRDHLAARHEQTSVRPCCNHLLFPLQIADHRIKCNCHAHVKGLQWINELDGQDSAGQLSHLYSDRV